MGVIIKQSILSGVLVGLGVVLQIQVQNTYIGAMLFSIALLVIIECDLKLYTGKIGFFRIKETKNLLIILMGNLVGVLIPIFCSILKGGFYEKVIEISNTKFSNGHLELFLYGLMCGVLMFIAVYCKKSIIIVFCIMTFILSGYEHCIACFPYLVLNFNINYLLKFLCIVLGNSIGAISINKLIKSVRSKE
jgi:formate/nitrite transporter FocA (FNT family)